MLAAFVPGAPYPEIHMSLRILFFAVLAATTLSASPAHAATPEPKNAQVVELTVTSKGFEPSVVTVKAGKPVKLVVTRKTERTCATEIVMKDFGVNQPLPYEKPVTVVVSPKGPGQYRFACGMDMIAGVLKVQ
jgi:plastocyanin domain-containing protein